MLPIIFLSIDLFGVDRCITALRCWKDLGMSCCVRCCKHSGHAADQCGSEIASSSFMCHCLTSWGIWDIRVVFFTLTQTCERRGSRKLTVSHKSRAPAPGEKTSGCFQEQHRLTSSHLSHSSISASPRAVAFSSQVCWAVGHAARCSLALLFLSPAYFCLHLSTASTLTHTSASRVSCLIPSTPLSPSPGGGHRPTGAICLHVMKVWGCGVRLVPPMAQRRGAATTDA